MLSFKNPTKPATFRERFQLYGRPQPQQQQCQPEQEHHQYQHQPSGPSSHKSLESHLHRRSLIHQQIFSDHQLPALSAEHLRQHQQQFQRPQGAHDTRVQGTAKLSTPALDGDQADCVAQSGARRCNRGIDYGVHNANSAVQHGGGATRPASVVEGTVIRNPPSNPPRTLVSAEPPNGVGRGANANMASQFPRAPLHRRASSSPAISAPRVQRYDDNLLKPPPRFRPHIPPPPSASVATARQYSRPSSFTGEPQSTYDFVLRTERSLARGASRTGSPQNDGLPVSSSSAMEAINYADPDHRMLNRPRKLSNSSIASSSFSSSRESFNSSSPRSPGSWSSVTSFESMDFINKHSGEYVCQRSSGGSGGRLYAVRSKPGELFAALPGEVLELILDELKKLHLGKGADGCATCWMRDLCSICVTSRKWSKFARTSLYEDIQLNGPDSTAMKKRYKPCPNPRLVLLRRTLRTSQQIAVIVHSLKVPAIMDDTPVDKYHDLVASVVMACPNLERLVGLYPRYTHSFDRLFHALSTRQRLKRMDWIVDAVPAPRPQSRSSSKQITKAPPPLQPPARYLTPGDISPAQSSAFLDLHLDWRHLTTLNIHTLPGGSLTPDNLIPRVISYLPALQHLFLAHLPFTAFKDDGLLSLPALKTLSLSYLPGITSSGLSALATRSSSRSIQRLILRHIKLDEMTVLARILSNLVHLESLAVVQSFAPAAPEDDFILLMPYLASGSLRRLHWDMVGHQQGQSNGGSADSILARSIAAGGFPSLRSLRAPNDPDGMFQSLCRPRDRVDLPGDRFRSNAGGHGRNFSGSFRSLSVPSSPTTAGGMTSAAAAGVKSPTSPVFAPDALAALSEATDLHQSRLAAQSRLEAAWRFPRFHVNVVDENGMLVDKFGLGGFIGTHGSLIRYCLTPDQGAKDENGGLVGVGDVLAGTERERTGSEACNGRWNMPQGPVDKKDKDKDRWWHAERGRWEHVEL